jgi:MFS transporter, putative metabolite:H+ symporter
MKEPSSFTPERPLWKDLLHPAVIVGALGYFVDIYDLTLVMAVKKDSLATFHVVGDPAPLADPLNWQMFGMLLGGLFFGALGDRMGRLTTLFGSILLYSIANIANGFATSIEFYSACRFVAGIGLAGELGGCISLVSEVLSKERRGYGTAMVATIGVFGAVVGGAVAEYVSWQTNYFIGGALGLCLLLARVSVKESGMYQHAKTIASESDVARGNFLALFTDGQRFKRYLYCILIGLPTWYMIGILVSKSEVVFAKLVGVQGIKANRAVAMFYLGLTFGDIGSGALSQWFRSRRKVVALFLTASLVCALIYLYLTTGWSAQAYYALIFVMGLGMGYWALFVTIAAEQFGTNLRATVATTVPNVVRGSLFAMSFMFAQLGLRGWSPITAGLAIGTLCFGAAFFALWKMEETFGKDLDYLEKK